MPDRQSDKTCAAEVFLERPLPNKDSLRIFNIRVAHTRVDPRADHHERIHGADAVRRLEEGK
jgi:hypothetical protein